jgi:hypothetical protein
VNNPPIANADIATMEENTAPIAINVLANDTTAPDVGETLTVTSVTQAARGAVAIVTAGLDAGRVRYTPQAGFVGIDTFTYTIGDGRGGSATALVTVTVTSAAGSVF